MPKHANFRELDLSAAQPNRGAAPKPLSDRQLADYKAALNSLKRWLTKQRRANNTVAKYQRKVSHYEKLLKVFPLR
jgi:hypothetical protein